MAFARVFFYARHVFPNLNDVECKLKQFVLRPKQYLYHSLLIMLKELHRIDCLTCHLKIPQTTHSSFSLHICDLEMGNSKSVFRGHERGTQKLTA